MTARHDQCSSSKPKPIIAVVAKFEVEIMSVADLWPAFVMWGFVDQEATPSHTFFIFDAVWVYITN
eukprot:scaffold284477_cov19-Prasinocladus_malaysianus.AAC.1